MRGTIITLTLQEPTAVPRTELPTNLQRVVPDVMLIRMVPCDFRGMDRPAAAAMRAADTLRRFFTVRVRDTLPVVAAVRGASPGATVDVETGADVPSVSAGTEPGDAGEVDVVGDVVGDVPAVPGGAMVVVVVVVETVSDDTVEAAARSV
ncbi:MAG: hypothetical protein RLZZ526_1186, partial [Actinomycetota bacterium]